jgi:putative hemolysin
MKKLPLVMAATLAAVCSSAYAQDCAQPVAQSAGIIEIVQFRLSDGVTRKDFIDAAANTMSELCATDGFIGRILSKGEDGSWTDHVKWTTAAAAQSAMVASMQNEALLPFIMSIDSDSMVLSYQTPVALE